jgi:hypothetical protein
MFDPNVILSFVALIAAFAITLTGGNPAVVRALFAFAGALLTAGMVP